ncbi:MAG: PQQ-binding-like beta-propeller repeat protein [Haloferacaceae archaeon]
MTAIARDAGVVLYAHDAADGGRRWRRRVEYPSGRRYPQFGGLVGGTLYLTDARTDVVAVDESDGTVRWRVNLHERVAERVPDRFLTGSGGSPDRFSLLPLATPGTVYVQSSHGLHGLAPENGRERWRIYLGDRNGDSHVLEDLGGFAVGSDRVWASYGGPVPSVYTVETFDGSPTAERAPAPLDLPGRPVVTGDGDVGVASRVVWSTDAHEPLAFGVAGGTGVTWQFPGLANSGAAAFSSLATDGERTFVCEGHEQRELFVVYALRASTGGIEWTFRDSLADRDVSTASPAEFRLCQPVVVGDAMIAGYGIGSDHGTGEGTLVALSTADGRERCRTDLAVAPEDVAVTGDRVYVGGRLGGVLALAAD